jgi:hypothetical protein
MAFMLFAALMSNTFTPPAGGLFIATPLRGIKIRHSRPILTLLIEPKLRQEQPLSFKIPLWGQEHLSAPLIVRQWLEQLAALRAESRRCRTGGQAKIHREP